MTLAVGLTLEPVELGVRCFQPFEVLLLKFYLLLNSFSFFTNDADSGHLVKSLSEVADNLVLLFYLRFQVHEAIVHVLVSLEVAAIASRAKGKYLLTLVRVMHQCVLSQKHPIVIHVRAANLNVRALSLQMSC